MMLAKNSIILLLINQCPLGSYKEACAFIIVFALIYSAHIFVGYLVILLTITW